MKHLKLYERRNKTPYLKYVDVVNNEFYHDFMFNIEHKHTIVYKEDGTLYISFKVWGSLFNGNIDSIKETIGSTSYSIYPNNGDQMTILYEGVSEEYLSELNLRIETNKYNL